MSGLRSSETWDRGKREIIHGHGFVAENTFRHSEPPIFGHRYQDLDALPDFIAWTALHRSIDLEI